MKSVTEQFALANLAVSYYLNPGAIRLLAPIQGQLQNKIKTKGASNGIGSQCLGFYGLAWI